MINLLPPDSKKALHYARMNVVLIQYVILVIFVGISVVGIVIFGGNIVSANEKEIQSAIDIEREKAAALLPSSQEAKELSEKIDTIGNLLNQEVKFSELLREIGSLMPQGSILLSLSVSESKDDPITLDAGVIDADTAAVLRENLAGSDVFDNADILSVTLTDEPLAGQDGQVYNYGAKYQVFFAKEDSAEAQPQPQPTSPAQPAPGGTQ